MDNRPIVCVDLDGVLNDFDKWRGASYFHEPRPGAREFLEALNAAGYRVVVFTVRWAPDVREWLSTCGFYELVSEVTNIKPPAHVYVDDRAVCFDGDFADTLSRVVNFRAHWERSTDA